MTCRLASFALIALGVPLTIGSALFAGAGAQTRSEYRARIEVSASNTMYIQRVESCIERLRSKVEEWGVVTASVPIVIKVEDQFKLDKNPSDFPTVGDYIKYQQGNVAGGSFQSTETSFTGQGAADITPATPAAPANPTGAAQSAPAPSGGVDFTKQKVPDITISNTLGGTTAAPGDFLGKAVAKPTGIPGRAAILLGVNDKLTERILTKMASPPVEKFVNKDYSIAFAIVQVSVNPGWRTRENYIADLTATCEYYNSKASAERILPQNHHEYPLVFSVLPLLDAQNLELGNSDRQVTALAAQVRAAYPTVGLSILGQELITFVHRYQKDSITRAPVTVTNSYTEGRTFGFRFAPSFTAQADPAYRKSRAANILAPTAFPVLVTVVTKDKVFVDHHCDSVVAHISTRWLIKDRPPLTVWYKRLYTPLKRNTFAMRMNWAEDVSTLNRLIDEMDASDEGRIDDPVLSGLRNDALELSAKCGPQNAVINVRQESKPAPIVDTTEPSRVPSHEPFSIMMTGLNFEHATKVILGGKESSSFSMLQDRGQGSTIVAAFPEGPVIAEADGNAHLVVISEDGVSDAKPLKVFETKSTGTPTPAATPTVTPTPTATPAPTVTPAVTPTPNNTTKP
jgi:hypothetical protein